MLLGKAGGPFSSSEVLSFNMPPAKNLAAPVARAGEGMQSVLSRRDAYANSATTPAVQEVSGLLQHLELGFVKLARDHLHVLILSMLSVGVCWCQVLDCCHVWLAAQQRACPWRNNLMMWLGSHAATAALRTQFVVRRRASSATPCPGWTAQRCATTAQSCRTLICARRPTPAAVSPPGALRGTSSR